VAVFFLVILAIAYQIISTNKTSYGTSQSCMSVWWLVVFRPTLG